MVFTQTHIPGVVLVEPIVYSDERGFFVETYQKLRYQSAGVDVEFVQDNHSRSPRGTLRGLHLQTHKPQAKLVRCTVGEIFDVAVDVRPWSCYFGQWVGTLLSEQNFTQLYMPPGFAHGFCVLSDVAQVEYKCSDYYDPDGELCIRWDDGDIGIQWPLTKPTLSAKDAEAVTLAEAKVIIEGIVP